jgi:hypothetical protein
VARRVHGDTGGVDPHLDRVSYGRL